MTFWVKANRRAVLGRNARTADAIKSSARVCQLNDRGKANASKNALLAQCGLFYPERVIVHELTELFKTGLMRKNF